MPTLKQRLQFILEGGRVVRYHTRRGLKDDTDAQHSHGVALISHLLWIVKHPGTAPSVNMIMGALTHDLAEQAYSDVSSHTKRALQLHKQLATMENTVLATFGCLWEVTEEEARIIHIADQMEGLLNACYERSLGNTNSCLVFRRYMEYLTELKPDQYETKLITAILSIWEEACGKQGFSFEALKCQ